MGEDVKLVTLYWDSAPVVFCREAMRKNGKVCSSDLTRFNLPDDIVQIAMIMMESFIDLDVVHGGKVQVIFMSCLN